MELMNNKIIYFEKRLEMNELKKIIKEYIKKIGKDFTLFSPLKPVQTPNFQQIGDLSFAFAGKID